MPCNVARPFACDAGVTVNAQDGPIRILVGFPPGGESDLVARLLADGLRSSLGVPVLVDNRPGASGMLAAELLKNAAPDGRTLMVAPIAVTVFAPLTQARLRYDPLQDFAPVSLAANFQMALAVGPGSPAATLHEYLDWVRAIPAKAVYGVPLAGGPTHFFGVMLARAAGVDLTAVPYKGSAAFVSDLLGGLPAGITVLSQLIQTSSAGKVRLLATSGAQRSPLAPTFPSSRTRFCGHRGHGLAGRSHPIRNTTAQRSTTSRQRSARRLCRAESARN